MCRSSWLLAGRVSPAPGERTCARRAIEHAARDAGDARPGDVAQLVGGAFKNGARGAQPAAHRRPDALAQIARGEPGGIAGDEGVAAAYGVDIAAQVIAVAGRLVLHPGSQARVEHRGEIPPVGADVVATVLYARGDAAHADVEPAALLGDVPGV